MGLIRRVRARRSLIDWIVARLLIYRWGSARCANCSECIVCGAGALPHRRDHLPNCPGNVEGG